MMKCVQGFERVSYSAAFGLSYEYWLKYLESLETILGECGRRPWVAVKHTRGGSPEGRFTLSLCKSGYVPLQGELVDTATYLRHRRNQLFHAADTVGMHVAKFIAAKGGDLNAFWCSQPAVKAVDFASPAVTALRDEEMTGLLRTVRLLVELTDRHVKPLLDLDKVVARYCEAWAQSDTDWESVKTSGHRGAALLQVISKRVSLRFQSEFGAAVPRKHVATILAKLR